MKKLKIFGYHGESVGFVLTHSCFVDTLLNFSDVELAKSHEDADIFILEIFSQDYVESIDCFFEAIDADLISRIENDNILFLVIDHAESTRIHDTEPIFKLASFFHKKIIYLTSATVECNKQYVSLFKKYIHVPYHYMVVYKNALTPRTEWYEQCLVDKEENYDKRRFLCLNHSGSLHRILFYSLLFKNKMLDSFLFSFWGGYDDFKNDFVNDSNNFKFGLTANDFMLALNETPISLDVDWSVFIKKPTFHFSEKLVESSYLSIITESYYTWEPDYAPNTFHSEKTFLRIAAGHPFIILGDAGINKNISAYGFEPYTEFILNGFDDELNPEKRILLFFENMKTLYSMPDSDFLELVDSVKGKVKRNMERYHSTEFFKSKINGLLNEIVSA